MIGDIYRISSKDIGDIYLITVSEPYMHTCGKMAVDYKFSDDMDDEAPYFDGLLEKMGELLSEEERLQVMLEL